MVAALETPPPVVCDLHAIDVRGPADSALVAVSHRDGVRTAQRLADAQPHARDMRWLAGPD